MKLTLKKYLQEGDLAYEYNPFHNMVKEDGQIVDFEATQDQLDLDLTKPLDIECQPSYDGTVNLIINDDKNPPRIVNSRFTKIENNRYRIISRNQKEQTNLYKEDMIDQQTRLFRTLNKIPKFRLHSVSYFGQLKGGNYTFYLKYADNDYNKTDIIAETGEIPIFKGTLSNIRTISGTLEDERTDKSIKLKLTNIDTSFSKIYLIYSRTTSDINGYRKTSYEEFIKPYDITGDEMVITINGFEDVQEIKEEDINIKYNLVDAVKTHTQLKNRLFFGNVEKPTPNNTELQNISYYINVELTNKNPENESIGYVNVEYNCSGLTSSEYYNPQNVYYRLGYWPEEIYRLGVVYIMNDDSLSPVYNLRGCKFEKNANGKYLNFTWGEGEYPSLYNSEGKVNYVPKSDFLNNTTFDNTYGVFKNAKLTAFNSYESTPLYYKMGLMPELIAALKKQKVKGLFFVRQRRIPTTLCQGIEIGINKNSYTPMLWNGNYYIGESFKSATGMLTTNVNSRLLKSNSRQSSGLITLDPVVNHVLQSNFDGSEFILEEAYKTSLIKTSRNYKYNFSSQADSMPLSAKVLFVPEDTSVKVLGDLAFSSKAGDGSTVSEFSWWDTPGRAVYKSKNPNLVRGIFCNYLGTDKLLQKGSVYNIKISNYNEAYLKDYFNIRGNDISPFYAISDRYDIYEEDLSEVNVYRGDCFINTISIRVDRNFIDADVPIDDTIVDEETWKENYYGYYGAVYKNGKDENDKIVNALDRISNWVKKIAKDKSKDKDDDDDITRFYKMNRADINAVPMGIWVTFKCLSNYHLGLRSIDRTNTDEIALMGNPRSFYPLNGLSVKSGYKISESGKLSDGYSSTVGARTNFIYSDVPYIKDQFDNRIMFSNLQVNDEFKNSYRIFESLCYQDIDRQYGAIVKLYPWYTNGNANLLCIFEHGIGVVPVDEKALIQTTTGQNIHMYGAGVISPDVTVLSDDFGSMWEDSIIKTPLAIYGVDTYAKKIWKVPLGGEKGVECISDMNIQQFLNDNISFKESDKTPIIALRNVKTHYNNYKGDVMFTFYDYEHNKEWNFCYNERQQKWITRYSWTPLASENINNCYYSFDKKRAEILAYVADNRYCTLGLHTSGNNIDQLEKGINLTLVGYEKLEGTCSIELTSLCYKKDNEFIYLEAEEFLEIHENTIFCNSQLKSIEADYFLIEVKVTPRISTDEGDAELTAFSYTLGIINTPYDEFMDQENPAGDNLRNGLYVHGRAGIYDELDYFDESMLNHILPTYWYDKQEPFEFEFVVSQPTGLHKMFDNLVLISNNVEPESFEFEIIGDVFNFNKAGLYWDAEHCTDEPKIDHEFDEKYNPFKESVLNGTPIKYQTSQKFSKKMEGDKLMYDVEVTWDHTLNTYGLRVKQGCKNILDPKYGRLQGNIHYKEDSWYLTIDPIKYTTKYKLNGEVAEDSLEKEARIRDKYCKIRVKYKGDKLAIITSLKTLITMSYA